MRIWDYNEPELKHGELKIMYNVTLRKKIRIKVKISLVAQNID